ncbi:PREDICTED: tumor necrosis factor receptor superfamily member 16 [Poecilia mexicana]|uniref:Nerve growth factor receptor b n=1 Tax=Poecilia mexicana TaxID=48701 RepID=A0A3B3XR68_9TELE|nr:PREDICTED: tumor necrosis factor receptor superfamily member 16 [Poecilia mexicana]
MQRRYRMKLVLIAALLGLAGAVASLRSCPSGQNTTSGECCKQCPPGEGVVTPCGAKQTECAPCLDSETFSENFSHTEKCQPCTKCTGLLRMSTPCTDTNDAICTCNYGYYHNKINDRCEACTKCPEGHGMLYSCESDHDTVCEQCDGDTFSDQDNFRDPCIPCTTCDEDDEVVQDCSPVNDTICRSNYQTSTPDGSFPGTFEEYNTPEILPPEAPSPNTTTTTTTTSIINGDSKERLYQGINDKLIPIYCSILAAVVVGLVAFIIFKRWNSCKQNKQGANNCTTNLNQTPSPEGEKLHSDSGISVDSQSLQEQQGQTQSQTVVTIDEEPCLLLPLHTREKVEKLLFQGSEGENCDHMQDSDWCNLAGLLGYEEERIATFQQEEHPVRALLSDWARKDCASVDALCTALRKINRDDIAQSLVLSPSGTKPTATSVV